MKKTTLLFCLFLSAQAFSQSPRTVIVEHFTNSSCGICGNNEPAFYRALSFYPQVLHISFHPSAPYASCFFNQQNKTENDDRTKYYGVYGYTPVVVLNGVKQPLSSKIISTDSLDAALGQTSPVEVKAYEQLVTADSVDVAVIVKTTGPNSYGSVKLFAGVAEDTIHKTTLNYEQVHYDVFRKTLTIDTGNVILLPALNDSVVFHFSYKANSDWVVKRTYTMAIVQLADTKEVLNAGRSNRVVSIATSIADEENTMAVFPNPVTDVLHVTGLQHGLSYEIMDILGNKVSEGKLNATTIDLQGLINGIYFLRVGNSVARFVKQ